MVSKIIKEKSTIFTCLISTFVIGLLAHAYSYFHDSFSHDALGAIYATVSENNWKIALGRFFVPLYRAVFRGSVALPWMIGVLALIWIGLSVYLVAKIFSITSRGVIILLAGIMTTNLTVTATTATFLYELDVDMFALLMATLAVFLWHKYGRGWLIGTVFVSVALGIYQAYISVTISLVILVLICEIVRENPIKQVILRGIRSVCMLILGGILYIVSLKIVCSVTGISLADNYNGLVSILRLSPMEFPKLIIAAYQDWFSTFLHPKAMYLGRLLDFFNAAILIFIGMSMVMLAGPSKHLTCFSRMMLLVLGALLPLGMNISYVLSGGMVHDLMRYAFWFTYLWGILLAYETYVTCNTNRGKVNSMLKSSICFLVSAVIWNNLQVSNALYLKKNLEQEAALSLMTRVADRLEMLPGYVGGETPVVFVGTPSSASIMPGFESISEIDGAASANVLTYNTCGMYEAYFSYILNSPINLASTVWTNFQTDARVAEMPSFPNLESIQKLDGVVVIKM